MCGEAVAVINLDDGAFGLWRAPLRRALLDWNTSLSECEFNPFLPQCTFGMRAYIKSIARKVNT